MSKRSTKKNNRRMGNVKVVETQSKIELITRSKEKLSEEDMDIANKVAFSLKLGIDTQVNLKSGELAIFCVDEHGVSFGVFNRTNGKLNESTMKRVAKIRDKVSEILGFAETIEYETSYGYVTQ